MGLFDKFRKKEAPAPVATASVRIETREVEVRQRAPGELTMADVGGYVSPSGGFINFGTFKVSGVNSTTGRKNTKKYEAQTEQAARELAMADGLADPITVAVESAKPVTDRQMEYALDLKATIPDGCCGDDVSAIIARITDEDEEAPDPGLSKYAHACGIRFSRFIGAGALLATMIQQMADADRATLYAYAVYLQAKGGSFRDPRQLPEFSAFSAFGASAAADPALVKSLAERDVFDFRAPNRGTKIYKAAAAALSERGVSV